MKKQFKEGQEELATNSEINLRKGQELLTTRVSNVAKHFGVKNLPGNPGILSVDVSFPNLFRITQERLTDVIQEEIDLDKMPDQLSLDQLKALLNNPQIKAIINGISDSDNSNLDDQFFDNIDCLIQVISPSFQSRDLLLGSIFLH